MAAIEVVVKKFPDMLLGFPWWNYLPKRWIPLYRLVELLKTNFFFVLDASSK
jgi:hypothetical protein